MRRFDPGRLPSASRATAENSLPQLSAKKAFISKGFARGAGYRAPASGCHFPLFSTVFSEGWELRYFSTQLRFSIISTCYETCDLAAFRNPIWLGEGDPNQKLVAKPAFRGSQTILNEIAGQ